MEREQSHDPGPQFQVLLSSGPCFEVQQNSQSGQIRIRGLDASGETDVLVQLYSVLDKMPVVYIFSPVPPSSHTTVG